MTDDRRLFGTDGVRGKANRELTPELAMDLARAAGEGREATFAVIGRDTRRSGQMLVSALMAGFNSVGVDTVDLGIIPVGGVSRLTRDLGAPIGVMVSASHNPADDNGIKFFGRDGAKLDDEREAQIERRLRADTPWKRPGGAAIGIQTRSDDAITRYVEKTLAQFEYSLRGIEVALDCANGAAFDAAPRLYRKVGATVQVFGAEPDGMNINAGCGATHPEYLASRAKGTLGLAFDGDADRLIAIDEDGGIANGDVIMAIMAAHLKERGKLKNNVVVTTVMSNLGFRKAMERMGIEVVETQVGDRYVLEAMRQRRAVLGGEQSGHILLEDRATGDGLRTGLRLLEIVAATGKPLTELRQVMTEYPQVLINVKVADRDAAADAEPVRKAIARVTQRLGRDGRVLVRPSGTEPVVRVMVEAAETGTATEAAEEIANVIRDVAGAS